MLINALRRYNFRLMEVDKRIHKYKSKYLNDYRSVSIRISSRYHSAAEAL